jgi:hypothetical protein
MRRGVRVTLVDAWGPANSRASSGDETRLTRLVLDGEKPHQRFTYANFSAARVRIRGSARQTHS